jgi:hypothetical protein
MGGVLTVDFGAFFGGEGHGVGLLMMRALWPLRGASITYHRERRVISSGDFGDCRNLTGLALVSPTIGFRVPRDEERTGFVATVSEFVGRVERSAIQHEGC